MSALELPGVNPLYVALQSKKQGGSGTGTSYWRTPSECGGRANLYDLFPMVTDDEDEVEEKLDSRGNRKPDGRKVGWYYHALQEMWRLGQFGDEPVNGLNGDYEFELAVQSFNAYRAFFKGDVNNLGRVIGVEDLLPSTEDQRATLNEFFGGIPVTMRYDLLVDMSVADVERVALTRNVILSGPGRYIIDYKLVKSFNGSTPFEYSFGMQQLLYPVVYNLCFPETPVKGILTDVMARVLKPEARHYALYAGYADGETPEVVREGIQLAARAKEEGRFNPFACFGKYGSVCTFLRNGLCDRSGTFAQYKTRHQDICK